MRALVTGGAGFIGSNLADALIARGDEVVIVDDLSHGATANITGACARGAQLEQIDIRDGDALRRTFAAAAPEVVFHLAAQADVRASIADPAHDAAVNVIGTINVLEAARQAGARRLVNTSTGGGIYGDVDTIPTPERTEPRPMAAYGQSKHCAEQYCAWASRLYGFETVTLRYGNVYGPRQDAEGDAGVVAIFCRNAIEGRPSTVFGDGRQTRDFIYVGDVVSANITAAEHSSARGPYNIGTEVEATVLDLADAVASCLTDPAQFELRSADARVGELRRSCLDVRLARAELGFVARVGLADGVRRTFAYAVSARQQAQTDAPEQTAG